MFNELINHLWQSTLFAIVAGLITLAFRSNHAYVRYSIWLCASLKFLLPFSLLVSMGNRLEWAPAIRAMPAASSITLPLVEISHPFSVTPRPALSVSSAPDWAAIAVFGLWACGFAAIALVRLRGWRRVRAAVRSSSPLTTLGTMQIRSSPDLLEPGVVGLFRPILVLPAGIEERLQPLQMQAVLAHELCHVQRRDNFTSALHMIVEAIFWFHPLVWWIGARLIEERERACDEAVLSLGNNRNDYAEGILNICKSYLESPLFCVPGVTGSNLKKRIQAILTGCIARDLTLKKKLILAAASLAAVGAPIVAGILGAPRIRAQAQSSFMLSRVPPKFQAASLKPCDGFRKGTIAAWSPGTLLQTQCTTVERLLQQSYGLFANGDWNVGSSLTIAGGPAWVASDFYQIEAKAAAPQSRAVLNGPMLQGLLEDRFKLRVHRETRDVPVYALTVSEGGPKLQRFQGSCTPRDFDKPPSPADCAVVRGRNNGFYMSSATMADFCRPFLVILDRPVIDKTGLTGRFDIHLELTPHDLGIDSPRALPAVSNPAAPASPSDPSRMFAEVRNAVNKLGLNLEPATGPGDFLIIDHIEKTSAN